MAEYQESEQELTLKVRKLATLIRKSNHITVFTGAGISTSAGIPDYRGPQGTWTLQEQGIKQRESEVVDLQKAKPTLTHMALYQLQQLGILKYIISQNCDGLHRKSGINSSNISELHGNTYLEYCSICSKEYLRDFDTMGTFKFTNYNHETGRICSVPHCNGKLRDTIINFNEHLNPGILEKAWKNTIESDLFIVLGSSCCVAPACEMPLFVGKKKGANLVICNLQTTPLDDYSSLRIYSKTDLLFSKLFDELSLTIPPFILNRKVNITLTPPNFNNNNNINDNDNDNQNKDENSLSYLLNNRNKRKSNENDRGKLGVMGVDEEGVNASFIKGVTIKMKGFPKHGKYLSIEPLSIPLNLPSNINQNGDEECTCVLKFMGNCDEKDLPLTFNFNLNSPTHLKFDLNFNPSSSQWTVLSL